MYSTLCVVLLLLAATAAQEDEEQNMGRFAGLATPRADPILGLKAVFLADEHPDKMELTIGAYRDDDGAPWVLPSVAEAKARAYDHEYLPIEGLASFLRASQRLLYGEEATKSVVANVQALSGTGAVRLALEFLRRHSNRPLYVPATTWANHRNIGRDAGFPETRAYRYLRADGKTFDEAGLLADLRAADQGSIVLLHLCAHNPSGVDPSPEQWERIADAFRERSLLPLFDAAYLGFASGDVDRDAAAFRLFVSRGLLPWACVSFSKNFGLYSERVGAVHATVSSEDERSKVVGHFKLIARPMYSNPPAYGARIVAAVLEDPALERSWRASLRHMADRIATMRALLRQKLEEKSSDDDVDWSHITSQIGMFSFTGLTPRHVRALRDKHHVYILDNGRLSMAGVNTHNVDRLAAAVVDVLKTTVDEETTTTRAEL